MAETKETLQKDIENKTKELDALKTSILAETLVAKKEELETQKTKLEEEIKILQEQFYELRKIEEESLINQNREDESVLKNNVEADTDWFYEDFIKSGNMYKKLEPILWSEVEVKKFALQIDKVVRKYFDQELVGFSNTIKNSMIVGVQVAMMETFATQWATWTTEFFEAFSTTKSTNSWKAFEWLYKSFWKLWSANQFFVLANKVQNITRYLSGKKNIITASDSIPELMNPYKFKDLLNKTIRSNQATIDQIDISTILSIDSTDGVDMTTEEKAKIQAIIDKVPLTEKSVKSIQKSLKTADKLLDNREKLTGKATDLVDKLSSFFDINIPLLGNVGELLGFDFPTDAIKNNQKNKKGGLLNFVLGALGFRWGMDGLHRKYIQEKLDTLEIDDNFVAITYKDFSTSKNNTPSDAENTCTICGLTDLDETKKAKIPADYKTLKKAIFDNLSWATLNGIMVEKFAPDAVETDSNKKKTVDASKITEANIDTYLQDIIPKLAKDDFISSDKVDKDAFALAVIGGLVGDKYFVEGVNLGLVAVTDFSDNSPIDSTDTTLSVINGQVDFSKWKFSAEQIKNINFLVTEMKNINITNPYTQVGILACIAKESGFVPKSEIGYAKSSNTKIRSIFGSRIADYTDTQLDVLKTNDKEFFDAIYNQYKKDPATNKQKEPKVAQFDWNTGNDNEGDGYTYRGRWFNGLTFKSLYKKYGDLIGEDLVTNPDLANDPVIAAKIALEFFKDGNDGKDLSTLSFTDKTSAVKKFADINAWGHAHTYTTALAASTNFDIKDESVA